MNPLLRAWILAGALALAGQFAVGVVAAEARPDGWVLNAAGLTAQALTAALVCISYGRRRPHGRPVEYAVSAFPIPALVCGLSAWIGIKAGQGPARVAAEVALTALVVLVAAAAGRRWRPTTERREDSYA